MQFSFTTPWIKTTSITVQTSAWSSNTATAAVSGITSSNVVLLSYADSTWAVANTAGIRISAVGTNSITLKCETTPTASVTLDLVIF